MFLVSEAQQQETKPSVQRSAPAAPELSAADMKAADAVVHADSTSPGSKVAKVAAGQNGYHEQGTNHTKYGSWYGMQNQPWCDIFVSWVFNEAGELKAVGGKHALTTAHADWFKAHGRFFHRGAAGGGPKVGAVIFFDLSGDGGIDHVGIVSSYTDSYVYTVEGNRSDRVARGKYARTSHLINGYGHPDWK